MKTNHEDHFRALKELKCDTTEILIYNWCITYSSSRWMGSSKHNPNLKTTLKKTTCNRSLLLSTKQGVILSVCEEEEKWYSQWSDRTDTHYAWRFERHQKSSFHDIRGKVLLLISVKLSKRNQNIKHGKFSYWWDKIPKGSILKFTLSDCQKQIPLYR